MEFEQGASAPEGSADAEPSGYLHPRFAASLGEFGRPRHLSGSGGWLLVRSITGSNAKDAIGGYRHLFCDDWSRLGDDLAECQDLVSLMAVPDPFAPVEQDDLRRLFPDLVRPYKTNHVIDLRSPTPSRHHRVKVRTALEQLEVDVDLDPAALLDEWEGLYAQLRRRHSLTGINAFSRSAFAAQLATPGCVAIRAQIDGSSVSTMLFYIMGDVAHFHLGASSDAGYRVSASYAVIDAAIAAFPALGVRWLNLGGSAGVEANESDGLARFKRGWTALSRDSYLCGRVIDHDEYVRLSADRIHPMSRGEYFPAYRAGEHA